MIDVCVVLLNDNFSSTAIGPIEVFHSAGQLWNVLRGEAGTPRFRVTAATVDGAPVTSPYGLQIQSRQSIRDVRHADLIVVPASGLDFDAQFARHHQLFPWLQRHAARGAWIAGNCSGAAYLAEAGLLDGREATTHWAIAEDLRRRYPKVRWSPDKVITEDRRMLCSGGVYASLDVSLYLVEKFCGHEVALQCARALLIDMPRVSQSGYAVLPLSRPHDDDKVRAAEDHMERNYAGDVSIERLACDLGMSPRNFVRRFKLATGRLPGNYLQALRVTIARELIEKGARSLQEVASAVGYDDAAYFRALFKRLTGMTPADYRERFASLQPRATVARLKAG